MDKYYTPELNEFCLDFEYEEKLNGVYEKKVFNGYTALIKKSFCGDYGDWYDSIEEDIESDRIRVKYLDKEDIKSLGWELKTDLYIKDNLTLQVHKDSITIKYYDNFNNEWKTKVEQINIKNKSELKKLLKQLGIG